MNKGEGIEGFEEFCEAQANRFRSAVKDICKDGCVPHNFFKEYGGKPRSTYSSNNPFTFPMQGGLPGLGKRR